MWLAIEYELNLVPGTIFFNISAPPTPDLSGNRWSKDFFKLPVLAFCCFQFIVLTWEKTAVEQRVSVGVYCCAAAIHDGHADGHWSMVMPMVMVMSCQWSCYLWWSCWQLMVMPVPSAKNQFWYEVASLGWESHIQLIYHHLAQRRVGPSDCDGWEVKDGDYNVDGGYGGSMEGAPLEVQVQLISPVSPHKCPQRMAVGNHLQTSPGNAVACRCCVQWTSMQLRAGEVTLQS